MKYLLAGLCSLCLFASYSQEAMVTEGPSEPNYIISEDTSISNVADFDAVVRNNSKIVLSWRITNRQIEFFTIERSCNGNDFETIAVLKLVAGQEKMDWVDEKPERGRNQYRLRCSAPNNSTSYSRVVMAHLTGSTSFRFYPNPTDNILIVRSEEIIDILITDANGKVRLTQNQFSGLQTLNVSSLEKGVYILHVYNRLSNTHFQDKLVKN